MTQYVGGLRARLIKDSLYETIRQALDDLNWFDAGRAHMPINMRASEVRADEEIPLNTLALAEADQVYQEDELGSNLAEFRWSFFVDFYAENEAVGTHLIYDVRDILSGRMPSIGRNNPSFWVKDYTLAVPTNLFRCELENIDVDRAHDFPKPWQRFWYAVGFDVVDYYGDEDY